MADIAGTVGTFLDLATTWYKHLVTRKTADATLKNHIRNFGHYQIHIGSTIKGVFDPKSKRHFQVRSQAIWVLQLDESLRQWLFDAGFKQTVQKAGKYLVRARGQQSGGVYAVTKRSDQPGPLKFPRFGVTEKETHFDALFQKLKDAFERLEGMMSDDYYSQAGNSSSSAAQPDSGAGRGGKQRGSGRRGGYDSGEDDAYGDEYDAYAAWQQHETNPRGFSREPTRGQWLAQERALQDLSQRLEHGIGDMMIKSGRAEEYRRRRRARVGVERLHAEVLNEELALEAFHEEQQRHKEREMERRKLEILRVQRRAREARYAPEAEFSDIVLEDRGPRRSPSRRSPSRRSPSTGPQPPPPKGPPPRGPPTGASGIIIEDESTGASGRHGPTRMYVYETDEVRVDRSKRRVPRRADESSQISESRKAAPRYGEVYRERSMNKDAWTRQRASRKDDEGPDALRTRRYVRG